MRNTYNTGQKQAIHDSVSSSEKDGNVHGSGKRERLNTANCQTDCFVQMATGMALTRGKRQHHTPAALTGIGVCIFGTERCNGTVSYLFNRPILIRMQELTSTLAGQQKILAT